MSEKKKIIKKITILDPGKPTITLEAEEVLPEDISDSEIERRINDPIRTDSVGDLRQYWVSIGRRPCKYLKCTNKLPLDAPKNKEYCSQKCQKDAKSWRWRQKNPKAKMKADRDYLKSLPEEDFQD